MSKGNRCCNVLLIIFRVIQFLLSATALGCGIWICYVMFSMAKSAHALEDVINTLLDPNGRAQIEQSLGQYWLDIPLQDEDVENFAKVLDHTLVPVLHVLEGTPVRAILISIAALWSVAVIVYLHFAKRSIDKAAHQALPSEPNTPNLPSNYRPRRNRRSVRVCLSILTIVFWVVAIICAGMLAAEYSIVLFAGGAEMTLAFKAIKVFIQKALESAFNDDNNAVLRSLDIIGDITTIGALAILAIAASVICGAVEIISLFIACCTSGRAKQKPPQMQQYNPQAYQYQQVRSAENGEAVMVNPTTYNYGNSPTQMEKTPMISYTSPSIANETSPVAGWSPTHGQPQTVNPMYNTPNAMVPPTWNPVAGATHTPPPQQYQTATIPTSTVQQHPVAVVTPTLPPQQYQVAEITPTPPPQQYSVAVVSPTPPPQQPQYPMAAAAPTPPPQQQQYPVAVATAMPPQHYHAYSTDSATEIRRKPLA